MATQEETLAALTSITEQLIKATGEIIAALSKVGEVSPEITEKVETLKGIAQTLDDLNPDDVES